MIISGLMNKYEVDDYFGSLGINTKKMIMRSNPHNQITYSILSK
jgi:hypothetical protein